MNYAKYGLVLVVLLALSACASTGGGRKASTVRMECLNYIDYEACGMTFATMGECKAAQNRMIRSGFKHRERGACLLNVKEGEHRNEAYN